MDQINSAILRQFEKQGININEGVAIDARLVKSASRPVSNEKLKELREKHHTPEGKLDKNGNPKKFCRDLESDWTFMKDDPFYGLKEHASVDVNNGFILIVRFIAGILSNLLKRFMPTRDILESLTEIFLLLIRSQMAS